MYKCHDCGLVFDEPSHNAYDRTPGLSCESGFIEYVDECPGCTGYFSDAMPCIICEEEYVFTEDRDPFCDKCKKSIVKRFVNEFSQQEYEFLYDYTECKTYDDLVKEVK